MRLACLFGALILINSVTQGQTIAQPKYDAASIKLNMDGNFRFAFRIEPSGTLFATGITLKRLIMTAYNVQGFRIVGCPEWVAARRWDVQAKPDGTASPDRFRQMLQTLLEDRFQLHSHSEKRKLPVYELTVERNGSKLPPVKDSKTEPTMQVANGLIRLGSATTATFASRLSSAVARPVVDMTNLSGEFRFALEWTPEPGEDGGPTTAGFPPGMPEEPLYTRNGPSLFTAIREQLGLRLKSARRPVEVLVIDSVEMPIPN